MKISLILLPILLVTLLFVSTIIVASSPLITTWKVWYTGNKQEFVDVRFGWPIAFIAQDQGRWDPPTHVRRTVRLMGPHETVTQMLWLQFLWSVLIVFLTLLSGVMVAFMLHRPH